MWRKVVGKCVVAGEVCGCGEQGFWILWWTAFSQQQGSPRAWDDPPFSKFSSQAQAYAAGVLEKIEHVEPNGRPIIPLD